MTKYDESWYHRITKNSAKCVLCNDVIESKYRHDFVSCKCGKISVDGGTDYLKRSFHEPNDFVELSESRKFTLLELRDRLDYYNKNKFDHKYTDEKIEEVKHFISLWYKSEITK